MSLITDTIIAPTTAEGVAAIAVIRVSGSEAWTLVDEVFQGKKLTDQKTHTLHFGKIVDENSILDEVVVSLFKGPHSFTKEDVVEISTHGSPYIVQQVLQLLIRKGCRMAQPGEFTKRAFLNGRFDLAQAEAVADLISSESETAHRTAMHQMRGGFSAEINRLREQLVNFASLIELELDFGEEDVEFADRTQLRNLLDEIKIYLATLIDSFQLGNVIKNGVATVIAGKPNAGKSTLLNALLREEKAIVSDIAGTTRDFIEDSFIIEGIQFRFIDTAGLRDTTDTIEAIGVARTKEKMKSAAIIIYLFDLAESNAEEIFTEINQLENQGIPFLKVGNKVDIASPGLVAELEKHGDFLFISAADQVHIEQLKEQLVGKIKKREFNASDVVVTNSRHYESLMKTQEAVSQIVEGLDLQISGDFLAQDIKTALHHLGEITGEVTSDDVLGNIFSKFCIGK